MTLFHVTREAHADQILEEGLRGHSYANSARRIDQAEHALNTMLDRCGRDSPQYLPRDGSVFFWADRQRAAEKCADRSTVFRVEVADKWLPLTCATDSAIESLFQRVRDGYLNASTGQHGGLRPAYDTDAVEREAARIVEDDIQPWTGESDSCIQVWGLSRVDPSRISVVD